MDITNTIHFSDDEMRQIKRLYSLMGKELTTEALSEDVMFGYLTETEDEDENVFIWYLDELYDVAINVQTDDVCYNASEKLIG